MLLRIIAVLTMMLAAPAAAIPPLGGSDLHGPLTGTFGQAPPPARRKSIREFSAAELASLRRGFAQMIAWNRAPRDSANFRRSLHYWANIHAYFGEDCADPALRDGVPGLENVAAWPPHDPLSREPPIWCQCEHGTSQFLTWHRMYLYFFERVLQAAARDPKLRLPYWDYNRDGHLPVAYRVARARGPLGLMVSNPLRVEARQAELNSGADALDPDVVDTSQAMAQTRYDHPVAAVGFNPFIEQTPHGAVHCAVSLAGCPSGLMGSVPAAALDPIFYAHHANIDRLYECWLRVNEASRLPQSQAVLNQRYTFVDGDGSIVRRRVGDMLTSAQLGYSYTPGAGCPAGGASPRVSGEVSRSYRLRGEVRLERGTTVVPLAIPAELRSARRMERAVRPPRTFLVLDGVSADGAPGVLYKLYLQPRGGPRRFIGVLSFFDLTSPHSGHATTARRRVFDLGGAFARDRDELTLSIEPTTGLRGSRPAEAARRIDPRSTVSIESVQMMTLD